jgi:hypothetical protein
VERPKRTLANLQLSSACPLAWSGMAERSTGRFCSRCERTVHDTTAMSRSELTELLESHSGRRLCVRICRLLDGSLVTNDHPMAPRRRPRPGGRLVAALGLVGITACSSGERVIAPEEEPRAVEQVDEAASRLTREQLDQLAQLGYAWDPDFDTD